MVSATVVLPDTEVESALESLRNNRTLHRRGQSDTTARLRVLSRRQAREGMRA